MIETGRKLDGSELDVQIMREHPAWRGRFLGGTSGYSLPDLSQMKRLDLSSDAAEAIGSHGIKIYGNAVDSTLFIHPEAKCPNLSIHLFGRRGSIVIIDKVAILNGVIRLEGDRHICIIGSSQQTIWLQAFFRGNLSGLLLGKGCSSNGVECVVYGPEASIQIGDDAMISQIVNLWTSDSHGIISSTEVEKSSLNPPSSIVLGPHVWLGKGCTINKGRTIGPGAIVGVGSIVTRDVPGFTAVAGVPAEIRQVAVTWTRAMFPNRNERIAALAAANAGLQP